MAIDLREVEEGEARTRLRTGLEGRGASARRGKYPGKQQNKVRFPGAETTVWELRGHRPDPNFTGRDDTLAGVHRAFRAGRPTSAIQALTGLFGLGKTRLAIEYAHRHAAAYDAVWWVRAENEATLQGDYAELARELGLPFDKDSQAIAALRRKLRQEKNWPIIFDNAEKPDDVFPLLPDRHSGHVLITSQRHDWPHAETWPLAVLPPDTAAAYLVARGKVADGAVAREVAEALGGLPLALAQAASVIADGVGAGEYLDELRKDSPELFDQGDAVDYHQTVVSTWRASFTRLAAASSTAARPLPAGGLPRRRGDTAGRLAAGRRDVPRAREGADRPVPTTRGDPRAGRVLPRRDGRRSRVRPPPGAGRHPSPSSARTSHGGRSWRCVSSPPASRTTSATRPHRGAPRRCSATPSRAPTTPLGSRSMSRQRAGCATGSPATCSNEGATTGRT